MEGWHEEIEGSEEDERQIDGRKEREGRGEGERDGGEH